MSARRGVAIAVAAALTWMLTVDPAGLGSVAPAFADGGSAFQDREAQFDALVDSLETEQSIPASAAVPAGDSLEGPGALEPLPATAPTVDDELVVFSEEEPGEGGGSQPAWFGLFSTEDPPAAPAPVEVDLGGMQVTVAPTAPETTPAAVELRIPTTEDAPDLDITGVFFEVTDVSQNPLEGDAEVELTLSYESFAGLGGSGDWASRLGLLWIPDCEAATLACAPRPIEAVNDPSSQTLTAVVPVSPADSGESAPAALAGFATGEGGAVGGTTAIVAGAASDAGNWGATSLSPASSWGTSGNTGSFTWSYPLVMPTAPAGPAPNLTITYSSAASDGRTAGANNQSGMLGEGFDLTTSYIERSYKACTEDQEGAANNVDRKTGDLCWGRDNATLVFNGSSVELIFDEGGPGSADDFWVSKNDDGTKVERLTGGWHSGQSDEYWKVTTVDGTEYYFGRGKRSSSGANLNSAWTVPVYGNHEGDRCRKTEAEGGFAASRCNQVWRWNLDYVKDPLGNTMTYFYKTEKNHYIYDPVGNTAEDTVEYVSGGRLDRIEYGTIAGTEEGAGAVSAPAKVVFLTTPRCITDYTQPSSFCAPGAADTDDDHWLDSPVDLACSQGESTCGYSPTFFDRYRLSSITTHSFDGTNYHPINTWTMGQSFVPQGVDDNLQYAEHPMLALNSITRTAHAVAPVTEDIELPPVEFGYQYLQNRVEGSGDDYASLFRPRIVQIITETGATVSVNYRTECANAVPESASANDKLCYPVKWYPSNDATKRTTYFHKYVVESIVEAPSSPTVGEVERLVSGSPHVERHYDYVGGAAWVKPRGTMVDDDESTYSEFRGFPQVTTTLGTGDDVSSTVEHYFRGLNPEDAVGEEIKTVGPAGPSSDPLQQITATDHLGLEGQVFASVQYNGTTKVAETVTVPQKPTVVGENHKGIEATRIQSRAVTSFSYEATGALEFRTRTVTSYDENGQVATVDDLGELDVETDDLCTSTDYAHEAQTSLGQQLRDKHLVSLVASTEVVAVDCGSLNDVVRPDEVISHTKADYDGAGRLQSATRLNPETGVGDQLVTEVMAYDTRGRPTEVKDALGQTSTTVYQHSAGGLLASTTSTTPDPDGPFGPLSGFVSVTNVNPLTGTVTSTVDANGRATTATYDALGRLVSVRYPQHAGLAENSVEYDYVNSSGGLNAVITRTLGADGATQHTGVMLYDGLLRPFQSQAEGVDADSDDSATAAERGRMVSSIFYDSAGRVSVETGQWHASGAPAAEALVPSQVPPSQTSYVYDDAGRQTDAIFWVGTTSNTHSERWRTTTHYDGALVLQIPPTGGTPQATISDARGRTVELRQYVRDSDLHAEADTALEVLALESQSTSYVYDEAGQRVEMRDAANELWSYDFDWAGRQIWAEDPDGGVTTTEYDLADRVVTRTNANGDAVAYTYDALGRTTSLRDDSPSGAVRAQWEYDTALDEDGVAVLGQQASSTRMVDGVAYTSRVDVYDDAYRPLSTTFALPEIAKYTDVLGETEFTTDYTYTANGQVASVSYPAIVDALGARKLGAETVTTRYDSASMPSWMGGGFGWGVYVADMRFAADGRTVAGDLGNTYGTYLSYGYEAGTKRLTSMGVVRQDVSQSALKFTYGYDDAGNVTSLSDQPGTDPAGHDNQCFGYDGLQRLSVAWTALSGDCALAQDEITAADVGGIHPYWDEYEYDRVGNRTKLTGHDLDGVDDTVTTYAHGVGADGPHQLSAVSETTAGVSTTTTFVYDDAGNRVSKSVDGVATAYEWDREGELVGVGDEAYVYDASGSRIERSDADGLTIYLPGGQELRIDGTAVSASRYYSFGGVTVATRTGPGLASVTSLVADHHGSVVAAAPNTVNTPGSVERVYSDPFGGIRGGSDANLPGDHRFLGAVRDGGTGLTLLGARYYDEAVGTFISVDPLLDPGTPAQFNAYVYSWNNPMSLSDPSGLTPGTICLPKHGCIEVDAPGDSGSSGGSGASNGSGGGGGSAGNVGGVNAQAQPEEWWNPFSWSGDTWQNVGAVGAGVIAGIAVTAAIIGAAACTAATFGVCAVVVAAVAIGAGAAVGSLVTTGLDSKIDTPESRLQEAGLSAAGALVLAPLGAGVGAGVSAALKAAGRAGSSSGAAAGAASGQVGSKISMTAAQLQRKFKHASDFGVEGNYNSANGAAFQAAIEDHVGNSATLAIQGEYRGTAATHFLNPQTGLNVVSQNGEFVTGWRLSSGQQAHVLSTGKLGGG